MEMRADQEYVSVEFLISLFKTLGRLYLEVDIKVDNLQMCATSEVGYKAMHEYNLVKRQVLRHIQVPALIGTGGLPVRKPGRRRSYRKQPTTRLSSLWLVQLR